MFWANFFRFQKSLINFISGRSFIINPKYEQFLKDGVPFRILSGTFHYFRSFPETWERKLKIMKAAGLNTVCTYVCCEWNLNYSLTTQSGNADEEFFCPFIRHIEWSLHNPKENVYDFSGMANLIKFIELASKHGLLVIVKPGPYIGADRDFGGHPVS